MIFNELKLVDSIWYLLEGSSHGWILVTMTTGDNHSDWLVGHMLVFLQFFFLTFYVRCYNMYFRKTVITVYDRESLFLIGWWLTQAIFANSSPVATQTPALVSVSEQVMALTWLIPDILGLDFFISSRYNWVILRQSTPLQNLYQAFLKHTTLPFHI